MNTRIGENNQVDAVAAKVVEILNQIKCGTCMFLLFLPFYSLILLFSTHVNVLQKAIWPDLLDLQVFLQSSDIFR